MELVATRYAAAIFETARAEGQLQETLEQLALLGQMARQNEIFQRFLGHPDIEPGEKVSVCEQTLKGTASPLVRSVLHMITTMGRSEQLPQIADSVQALADEAQNRLKAMVRSAHPLPEANLKQLRTILERREGKSVELTSEVDPALLGGLQVRLGNRVIDASIRRQLINLRERLEAVRVH